MFWYNQNFPGALKVHWLMLSHSAGEKKNETEVSSEKKRK
jgi:hypothetical protein